MKFLKKNNTENNFDLKLEKLIFLMKNKGFLNDPKVEMALKKTPRHHFVPESQKKLAYENIPIPIMEGQTISQPIVVSKMTEWLDLKKGHRVLEIGGGSGWQSAIISNLVGNGEVFTLERHKKLADFKNLPLNFPPGRHKKLAEFAKKNLEKIGIDNITIIYGDGKLGLPEKEPFDRIIITAACKTIPSALLTQLSLGGLLLAPVGEETQSLVLIEKTPEGYKEIKKEGGFVFVPFI